MFTYIPLCIAITSEEQLKSTIANLEKSDKVKDIRIDGDKIKYQQLTWENKE